MMQNQHTQNSIDSIDNTFDLLFLVRLMFYILVALKLFEVVYLRKRKMNVKQRIYRKFLFAHSQIIRGFSDEDKLAMENTLNNTLKNANLPIAKHLPRKTEKRKKVSFMTQANIYYDPISEPISKEESNKKSEQIKDSDFQKEVENQCQQTKLLENNIQNIII